MAGENLSIFILHETFSNPFFGICTINLKKIEPAGNLIRYNFPKVFVRFGSSYTTKFFQGFVSFNNFLGIIRSTTTKNLNLCFGINLLFATKNY